MKTVNMNDYVYFELTDEGYEILDQHLKTLTELINQEISRDHFIKVDEKGFECMQLWQYMKIFGDHMMNSQRALVKSNNLFFK
jgi:hypothetical protein